MKVVKRPRAVLGIWENADYLAEDNAKVAESFMEAVDVFHGSRNLVSILQELR